MGTDNVPNSDENIEAVGRDNIRIPMKIRKGGVGIMYEFQWKYVRGG